MSDHDIILRVAKQASSKFHAVETVVEDLGIDCTGVKVVEIITEYEAKYEKLDMPDYFRRSVKWNLVLELNHLGASSAFHFPLAHPEGCTAMSEMLLRVAERMRKAQESGDYDSTGASVDARPMDTSRTLIMEGVKVEPFTKERTVLVESDLLPSG